MNKIASISRYSPVEQVLHWSTAILVLVAFIYGPGGHEARVYSSAHDFDRRLHETLGLLVLALTAVRLCWHMVAARVDPLETSRWMGAAARLVQLLLYVLLYAVPLSAIAGAWLEGHPLTWLGGDIAPLFQERHPTGQLLAEIHGWLGDAILWVAGLHAAAALYHHFLLRDGVLRSMLPGARH